MSYAKMDHTAWVKQHLAAPIARAQRARKKDPKVKVPPQGFTPFQARVIDILGMVGGGPNTPVTWEKADWKWDGAGFMCVWYGDLATFDFAQLTLLVFLCHEARIRVTLTGCGPRNLRLIFHQRTHEGGPQDSHPNLAEAVDWFKNTYLPPDHRIIYKAGAK